jgi:hypothetical protein
VVLVLRAVRTVTVACIMSRIFSLLDSNIILPSHHSVCAVFGPVRDAWLAGAMRFHWASFVHGCTGIRPLPPTSLPCCFWSTRPSRLSRIRTPAGGQCAICSRPSHHLFGRGSHSGHRRSRPKRPPTAPTAREAVRERSGRGIKAFLWEGPGWRSRADALVSDVCIACDAPLPSYVSITINTNIRPKFGRGSWSKWSTRAPPRTDIWTLFFITSAPASEPISRGPFAVRT